MKGAVASSLPVGLGAAVENAVAPAGLAGAIVEFNGTSTEDVSAAKVRQASRVALQGTAVLLVLLLTLL